MLKNDFLMREIESFSKFVIEIFRKEKFEIDKEQVAMIEDDYLFYHFQEMIYNGKINEAENALFETIEKNPKLEHLKLSEKFYSEVFKMSDEYLQEQNYSREEAFESLDQIKEIYQKKYNDSNRRNWKEVRND
ncbi:hypothetical protein GH810_10585 [Acetobacterium paludosum]|uniref:Uncharacterized protein n=1 Tax=Acetobacterium paludosum TaxID=52693 RepID=A0A923HUC2_9FIRM|nr:DUF6483 family protein [Acetobacterium paludosum]MBC3888758.1 hypothetical protein [Acetobacterium paludosum]